MIVVILLFHFTENTSNKANEIILSIELEERKLALLECQVKLRKEKAEAEAINNESNYLVCKMCLRGIILK